MQDLNAQKQPVDAEHKATPDIHVTRDSSIQEMLVSIKKFDDELLCLQQSEMKVEKEQADRINQRLQDLQNNGLIHLDLTQLDIPDDSHLAELVRSCTKCKWYDDQAVQEIYDKLEEYNRDLDALPELLNEKQEKYSQHEAELEIIELLRDILDYSDDLYRAASLTSQINNTGPAIEGG